MKKVVALVLAGGRTDRFGVLTLNRAKGALTFGGHYRIIDFALSNLRNSGMEQVGEETSTFSTAAASIAACASSYAMFAATQIFAREKRQLLSVPSFPILRWQAIAART